MSVNIRFEFIKGFIYDRLISFTSTSYREVITLLPSGTHLLDIGIGTATALIKNASLLQQKNILVKGIDIDNAYIKTAHTLIKQAQLDTTITVEHGDITQTSYPPVFNAIYFSGSFMLISPHKRNQALLHAISSLKNQTGQIFFTQTHEKRKSKFTEFIKPRIKFITSIDFGFVTYEAEFLATLNTAGLKPIFKKIITRNTKRESILYVAQPYK